MIRIIAAMTEDRIIGNGNALPWTRKDVPGELKWFEECTKGSVVIMGRKTWESLPAKFKPLPERVNVVVSRSLDSISGAEARTSLQDALSTHAHEDVWIIGGGEMYAQGLRYADELWLTKIAGTFEGDVYFPEFEHLFMYREDVRQGEGWVAQRFVKKNI